MLAKFSQDRRYLVRYHAASAMLLTAATLALRAIGYVSPGATFKPWHLALIPVAILIGIQFEGLIHRAAHRSIEPRLLGRLGGELAGFILLFTFRPFQIMHHVHHAHADDPFLDPHPTVGIGFTKYLLIMAPRISQRFWRYYGHYHGQRGMIWALLGIPAYAGCIVAAEVFWITLLGPSLILCLHLPLVVTYMLLVTHVNYYSHRDMGDGRVEIMDSQEGVYYRLMNWMTFGTYFHKSHHHNPKVNNPMRFSVAR